MIIIQSHSSNRAAVRAGPHGADVVGVGLGAGGEGDTEPPACSTRKARGAASYTSRRCDLGLPHHPPYTMVRCRSATWAGGRTPLVSVAAKVRKGRISEMAHAKNIQRLHQEGEESRPNLNVSRSDAQQLSQGELWMNTANNAEATCRSMYAPDCRHSVRSIVWDSGRVPASRHRCTAAGPPASPSTAHRSASRSVLYHPSDIYSTPQPTQPLKHHLDQCAPGTSARHMMQSC